MKHNVGNKPKVTRRYLTAAHQAIKPSTKMGKARSSSMMSSIEESSALTGQAIRRMANTKRSGFRTWVVITETSVNLWESTIQKPVDPIKFFSLYIVETSLYIVETSSYVVGAKKFDWLERANPELFLPYCSF